MSPTSGLPLSAMRSLPKRADELDHVRRLCFFASSKITIASVSVPAIGLSMKTGLPALKTSRASWRWMRPSTLSSSTTSTLSSNFGMESTISTPIPRTCSVNFATRSLLAGISVPPGYPATTLMPTSSPSAFGLLKSFVNAGTCEVSSPMMPARSGFGAS